MNITSKAANAKYKNLRCVDGNIFSFIVCNGTFEEMDSEGKIIYAA